MNGFPENLRCKYAYGGPPQHTYNRETDKLEAAAGEIISVKISATGLYISTKIGKRSDTPKFCPGRIDDKLYEPWCAKSVKNCRDKIGMRSTRARLPQTVIWFRWPQNKT